jgi:hypothetical protein
MIAQKKTGRIAGVQRNSNSESRIRAPRLDQKAFKDGALI